MGGKIFVVAVIALVQLTTGTLACFRSSRPVQHEGDSCAKPERWECGMCGVPIDVTLRVRNRLVKPKFRERVVLRKVNQRELLYLLFEAANVNEVFRFSMTHYGPELGVMVDGLNNLRNDWTSTMAYWKILYANGTALNRGVSNFIPQHRDEIVFEYTQYVPQPQ